MFDEKMIIKIQKWFRGSIFRLKHLPLMMYKIQKYLKLQEFQFSKHSDDGRINSCTDEDNIIELLIEKFGEKIKKPKIRMWYDILVFDNICGWIPLNIKTTSMTTRDNSGNLTMCVYAYTDEDLDIHNNTFYKNGDMSRVLFKKLKDKKYNKKSKKDYYFLVLNKKSPKDIIINSLKGLSFLSPNLNNLPFQICWNKNKIFHYKNINENVKLFIECIKTPKQSWKETFITNIKSLEL